MSNDPMFEVWEVLRSADQPMSARQISRGVDVEPSAARINRALQRWMGEGLLSRYRESAQTSYKYMMIDSSKPYPDASKSAYRGPARSKITATTQGTCSSAFSVQRVSVAALPEWFPQ